MFRERVRRVPLGHRQRAARLATRSSARCCASRIARDCSVGVIFFNNVGLLGMCGHGTIGLVASLAHAGRLTARRRAHRHAGGRRATRSCIDDGRSRSATCRAIARLRASSRRARRRHGCAATSPGAATGSSSSTHHGRRHRARQTSSPDRLHLARAPGAQCAGLSATSITSSCSATSPNAGADSRNFVLCPGKAYDRSPCGTGTSAKLACLAADGKLAEGEDWVQESVIGSSFSARYRWLDRAAGTVAPTISGRATSRPRARCCSIPRIRSAGASGERTAAADHERADRDAHPQQDSRGRVLAGLRRCCRTRSPRSSASARSRCARRSCVCAPKGSSTIEANRGFKVRPLSAAEVDEVFRLRLLLEPAAVRRGREAREGQRSHRGARSAACAERRDRGQESLKCQRQSQQRVPLALIVPHRQPVAFEILSRLHTLSQTLRVACTSCRVGRIEPRDARTQRIVRSLGGGGCSGGAELTRAAHRGNPGRARAVRRARIPSDVRPHGGLKCTVATRRRAGDGPEAP